MYLKGHFNIRKKNISFLCKEKKRVNNNIHSIHFVNDGKCTAVSMYTLANHKYFLHHV